MCINGGDDTESSFTLHYWYQYYLFVFKKYITRLVIEYRILISFS